MGCIPLPPYCILVGIYLKQSPVRYARPAEVMSHGTKIAADLQTPWVTGTMYYAKNAANLPTLVIGTMYCAKNAVNLQTPGARPTWQIIRPSTYDNNQSGASYIVVSEASVVSIPPSQLPCKCHPAILALLPARWCPCRIRQRKTLLLIVASSPERLALHYSFHFVGAHNLSHVAGFRDTSYAAASYGW